MIDIEKVCASSKDELFQILGTSQKGLTSEEVLKNLAKFGKNSIQGKRKSSFLKKIFIHLTNLFAILLWIASVLSLLLLKERERTQIIGIRNIIPARYIKMLLIILFVVFFLFSICIKYFPL